MIILVLAGGGGTRLWPLSRQDMPKQFHPFNGSLSLLQNTVSRFIKHPDVQKILIATNDQYLNLVETQIQEIDPEKRCETIVEPTRRNTAPAIAFAIRHLQETFGAKEDQVVLTIPSDHLIEQETVFLECLDKLKVTAKGNRMITFGIRPTKPETGYGYIEIDSPFDASTYEIKKFIEKPNLENAERYAKSPSYYWNSGMFLFSIKTFWTQLAQHAPDIYAIARKGVQEVRANYASFPDISIDYAVMEKCRDALVCPLSIPWSDVGSWDSVYEVLEKDANQNVTIGNIEALNTHRCLIINGKNLISTIGIEDLLIIQTDDVLLISRKDESQKLKTMVQNLINKGVKEATAYSTPHAAPFHKKPEN